MLRPAIEAWAQTVDDLRRLAIDSPHPRTRERFQALFMIASGAANASAWAKQTGREDETVLGWGHRYNAGRITTGSDSSWSGWSGRLTTRSVSG